VKIGLGMSLDKKSLKPLYDIINQRQYYPQVYQESFSAMMPIYERLHKMTLPQHLPKTPPAPAKRVRINDDDDDADSHSRRGKNHDIDAKSNNVTPKGNYAKNYNATTEPSSARQKSSQAKGVHRIYLSPTTYFKTEQEMEYEQRLFIEKNQALETWRQNICV